MVDGCLRRSRECHEAAEGSRLMPVDVAQRITPDVSTRLALDRTRAPMIGP
jgi:hypothetical protein